MKYRTKLFFAFCILALISNILAVFISYGETRKTVYFLLKENIISIISTTSVLIDGDAIEKFTSPSSMQTPAFQRIKNELRQIRDANRRHGVYVQYFYIFGKSPSNPDQYIFIVDSDEDATPYGYPYDVEEGFQSHIDEPYVPPFFTIDQWGVYLSGFAPIFNSEGKWVATLGIDLNSTLIRSYLSQLLIVGVIALIISLLIAMVLAFFLSRLVTNSLNQVCDIVVKIGQGEFGSRVFLASKDEFYDLSLAINSMAKGLQERERLKLGFARYVSKFVLEKILLSEKPTKLEGERKKVTVLFSDIRQFTTFSEKLPPEQVVGILNEYFAAMIEAIFKFSGTLDKFIGDGMMIEFGAPLDDKLQEKHAVQAALLMQLELKHLNQKWEKEGKPQLNMGIGIHSGTAVVGNVGSEKRMEYTAIGDTVNTASRLEQLTKTIKKPIIISKTVYEPIKDKFQFEPLGNTKLIGRVEEIEIYAVPTDQMSKEQIEKESEQGGLPST